MCNSNRASFITRSGLGIAVSIVSISFSALAQTTIKNETSELAASGRFPDDQFGASVAVSAGTGVVGAPLTTSGSVFVYTKGGAGEWVEQAQLLASDGGLGDAFGSSVALDNRTLVVGAPQKDIHFAVYSRGAAYVFTRDSTGMWTEQQRLIASDGTSHDWFGQSVAIDGDTLIIGAHRDGNLGIFGTPPGAAYVFTRGEDGVWTELQKLVPSDTTAGQTFGWAVDIDGERLIVGAPAGFSAQPLGAAYVFFRNAEGNWTEEDKLQSGDVMTQDFFGRAVAIDAETAVVGAPLNGVDGAASGAAFVFERTGGDWLERPRLERNSPSTAENFGERIAISGGRIVVGAPGHDGIGLNSGAAYAFEHLAGEGWIEAAMLLASDRAIGDHFGSSVALDGGDALFGASQDDDFAVNSGSAYAFVLHRFADVLPQDFAFTFIETLARSGITAGCGGGNYCPGNSVTRAQMAVFLERGINGSNFSPPAATGNLFNDVAAGDFAANFIERLANDGITAGCGNGNFCPGESVTRDQMAVFLLRAKHGSSYSPPAATGVFDDIDLGYWAAAWIEQLAAEGITAGCGGGNYCPRAKVTRDQMAVFLVRTFGL